MKVVKPEDCNIKNKQEYADYFLETQLKYFNEKLLEEWTWTTKSIKCGHWRYHLDKVIPIYEQNGWKIEVEKNEYDWITHLIFSKKEQ